MKKISCLMLVAALLLSSCAQQPISSPAASNVEVSYNPPKYFDEFEVSADVLQDNFSVKTPPTNSDLLFDLPHAVTLQHKDYKEVIGVCATDTNWYLVAYVQLTENSRFKRWQEAVACNRALPKSTLIFRDTYTGDYDVDSEGNFTRLSEPVGTETVGLLYFSDAVVSQLTPFKESKDAIRWSLSLYDFLSLDSSDERDFSLPWLDGVTIDDIYINTYSSVILQYQELMAASNDPVYKSVDGALSVSYMLSDYAFAVSYDSSDGDYGSAIVGLTVTNNTDSQINLADYLLMLYRDIPFEADKSNWGSIISFDNTAFATGVVCGITSDNKVYNAKNTVLAPKSSNTFYVIVRNDREGIYRVCFRNVMEGMYWWTPGTSKEYKGSSVSDYKLPQSNCGIIVSN